MTQALPERPVQIEDLRSMVKRETKDIVAVGGILDPTLSEP